MSGAGEAVAQRPLIAARWSIVVARQPFASPRAICEGTKSVAVTNPSANVRRPSAARCDSTRQAAADPRHVEVVASWKAWTS